MDKAVALVRRYCSPHWCYVSLSCFLLLSCNLGSAVVTPFLPFVAPSFGIERSGVALVMSSFSVSYGGRVPVSTETALKCAASLGACT
jgi:hypothetical protein